MDTVKKPGTIAYLSQLRGRVTARWFDPTNGKFSDVPGSPFANRGHKQSAPPPLNSEGKEDFVLVLEAAKR